jgi:hypothetical protein
LPGRKHSLFSLSAFKISSLHLVFINSIMNCQDVFLVLSLLEFFDLPGFFSFSFSFFHLIWSIFAIISSFSSALISSIYTPIAYMLDQMILSQKSRRTCLFMLNHLLFSMIQFGHIYTSSSVFSFSFSNFQSAINYIQMLFFLIFTFQL